MNEVQLSESLHAYLDDYCARHSKNSCPLNRCADDAECQSARLSLTLVSDVESRRGLHHLRRSFRDVECQQCLLVLIFQAMQRLLPAGEHLSWLNRPHLDLDGRTPRQCLEERKFLAVVDALWKSAETDNVSS